MSVEQCVQYRVKKRIGIGLRRFLLKAAPSWRYERLFDCDREFLRAFISHQFVDGMNWDNFGTAWQIGHVVPLVFFDQTKRSDEEICWDWINLHPISIARSRMWDSALAYDILQDRKKHFPENTTVDLLVKRLLDAVPLRENRPVLTDWSTFTVKNRYYEDIEQDLSDGHWSYRERYEIMTGKSVPAVFVTDEERV